MYIAAVREAQANGFEPFPEFPDLHETYYSVKPFPMLANRLMSPSRPERRAFLAALGLPDDAPPLAILARSGGPRVTDHIELFPAPEPETDGCYLTHCLLRAVRYVPAAAQDRILTLRPGERLFIMADVQNPADPQAAAVRTEDNHLIGYLPAYLADDVWSLRGKCASLTVHVERVNEPPAEPHHRLLCRVTLCWPDGIRPFDAAAYQPLGAGQLTEAVG